MIIYQKDNRNSTNLRWFAESQYKFTKEPDIALITIKVMEEEDV